METEIKFMTIGISAESTIDLPQEYLDKYGISIEHFHVQRGDQEGPDNLFRTDELFDFTKKTGIMCHTSAVNINELEEHFDKLLKKYDYIIHFTISSAISSGYNNAMAAAKGDSRIIVIDSHGTSGQIALQAIYARELIDNGYPFEEVVKNVLDRRPYCSCSFQLDTLEYLYKGGRCNKLALIGSNLLKIKPTIVCVEAENGKFTTGKKFRGTTKKCLLAYTEDILKTHPNIDPKMAFINYSYLEDPSILEEAKQKVLDFGFKEVVVTQASPTNGYHAGPNVFGVQFYFDGPHPVKPYKQD